MEAQCVMVFCDWCDTSFYVIKLSCEDYCPDCSRRYVAELVAGQVAVFVVSTSGVRSKLNPSEFTVSPATESQVLHGKALQVA
jgi:hypothetical protein